MEHKKIELRPLSRTGITVHPKPAAGTQPRAELSRQVRIALDVLSARGLATPRRARFMQSTGAPPFICG